MSLKILIIVENNDNIISYSMGLSWEPPPPPPPTHTHTFNNECSNLLKLKYILVMIESPSKIIAVL